MPQALTHEKTRTNTGPPPCILWGVCYNRGMKQEKALPQGTPREDNENIIEWFADNSDKVLQLVYLPSGSHYRFVRDRGFIQDGYWPVSKFSLAYMLDLLNR